MDTATLICNGKAFLYRPGTLDEALIRPCFDMSHRECYLRHVKLAADDVWLDVGGGLGGFALSVCDDVSHVACYEPCPENYGLLIENLRANNAQNVVAAWCAIVGNHDAEREFHVNHGPNTGIHSFSHQIHFGGGCQDIEKIKVSCLNVNKAVAVHGVNCIKLDCEGAEYEIVEALDLTGIRQVVMEFHPFFLCPEGDLTLYRDILQRLKGRYPTVHHPPAGASLNQAIIYAGD